MSEYSPEVEAQRSYYERLAENLIHENKKHPGIVRQYFIAVLSELNWNDPDVIRKFFVEMKLCSEQYWIDWDKRFDERADKKSNFPDVKQSATNVVDQAGE
jgi:hypothetical protein